MAIKQAMWIHGTSVQAEREGYFISKNRPAWGAEFKTQGSEWFHFAVPTPVIFGGQDSTLQKVFVLYKTFLGAKIVQVHVFDGGNKIQEFLNLQFQGDHSQGLDQQNTWIVNPIHVKFGLGLSILVDFGNATVNGVPQITFASAGADFLIM
jgi:hypothetical protein